LEKWTEPKEVGGLEHPLSRKIQMGPSHTSP
jgi:hypothetical protein